MKVAERIVSPCLLIYYTHMINTEILQYRIERKLGEGGMGVVCLAQDTRLQRHVAIKFLPHAISGSQEDHLRFQIEARANAALNHPNIIQIYAIKETDGPHDEREMFIVMEYIDGQKLKDIVGMYHDTPQLVNGGRFDIKCT